MDNKTSVATKVLATICVISVLMGTLLKLSGVGDVNIAGTILIIGIASAVSVLLYGIIFSRNKVVL